MNPSLRCYDSGMMNLNYSYLQNYMVDDMKNQLIIKIVEENISLRVELARRDWQVVEERTPMPQLKAQVAPRSPPSITKIQSVSPTSSVNPSLSDSESYSTSSPSFIHSADFKTKKFRRSKPSRNQTKNIPKNFGKAIICFIQHNKQLTRRILSRYPSISYPDFISFIRSKKRKINSISDLREFWGGGNSKEIEYGKEFAGVIRVLSNCFLRKYSLEYVFNSRISNYAGHVKYRARLLEALEKPERFRNIKNY